MCTERGGVRSAARHASCGTASWSLCCEMDPWIVSQMPPVITASTIWSGAEGAGGVGAGAVVARYWIARGGPLGGRRLRACTEPSKAPLALTHAPTCCSFHAAETKWAKKS